MPLTSGERFWYLEIGRGRWLNQLHLWTVARECVLSLPLLRVCFLVRIEDRNRVLDKNKIGGENEWLLSLSNAIGVRFEVWTR